MIFDTLELSNEASGLIDLYGREIVIRAENKAALEASKSFRPMSQYWIEAFLRDRKKFAKKLWEKNNDSL